MFEPDFGAFAADYDAGRPRLVVTRLVGDLETPVSAYLKLSRERAGSTFLLESVEGGAARGRYSMIGLDPDVLFRAVGDKAEINRDALTDKNAFAPCDAPPLVALRRLIAESAIPASGPQLPPMAAGVFGYLGYDMVRQMERLAPAKEDRIGVADALLMRPTIMVVFDTVRDEISIVTPVRPRPGVTAKAAYEAALARLDGIVATLEAPLDHRDAGCDPQMLTAEPVSNTPKPRFLEMVERAKEYIRAGDIFQVVLSQRFTAPFELPAFALYRALRRVNPAPFLCFLDFGAFQIVCSSP
ncbi:MAG: chorismate-binding protein, partial [Chloroflexota bacterium]